MCMASMSRTIGKGLGAMDVLDSGWGDEVERGINKGVSDPLSKAGGQINKSLYPTLPSSPITQGIQQTETRAARQGSALLN